MGGAGTRIDRYAIFGVFAAAIRHATEECVPRLGATTDEAGPRDRPSAVAAD